MKFYYTIDDKPPYYGATIPLKDSPDEIPLKELAEEKANELYQAVSKTNEEYNPGSIQLYLSKDGDGPIADYALRLRAETAPNAGKLRLHATARIGDPDNTPLRKMVYTVNSSKRYEHFTIRDVNNPSDHDNRALAIEVLHDFVLDKGGMVTPLWPAAVELYRLGQPYPWHTEYVTREQADLDPDEEDEELIPEIQTPDPANYFYFVMNRDNYVYGTRTSLDLDNLTEADKETLAVQAAKEHYAAANPVAWPKEEKTHTHIELRRFLDSPPFAEYDLLPQRYLHSEGELDFIVIQPLLDHDKDKIIPMPDVTDQVEALKAAKEALFPTQEIGEGMPFIPNVSEPFTPAPTIVEDTPPIIDGATPLPPPTMLELIGETEIKLGRCVGELADQLGRSLVCKSFSMTVRVDRVKAEPYLRNTEISISVEES